MRRIKPLSIYPPAELRSRLELISEETGRSINQQAIRWLTRNANNYEKKKAQRSQRQQQST